MVLNGLPYTLGQEWHWSWSVSSAAERHVVSVVCAGSSPVRIALLATEGRQA